MTTKEQTAKPITPLRLILSLLFLIFMVYTLKSESEIFFSFTIPLSLFLVLGNLKLNVSAQLKKRSYILIAALMVISLFHDIKFLSVKVDEVSSIMGAFKSEVSQFEPSSSNYAQTKSEAEVYAADVASEYSYMNNRLYIAENMYYDGFPTIIYLLQALLMCGIAAMFYSLFTRTKSKSRYIYLLNLFSSAFIIIATVIKVYRLHNIDDGYVDSENIHILYALCIDIAYYILIAAVALASWRLYKYAEANNFVIAGGFKPTVSSIPSLSDEENEYLEEYKLCSENSGEITDNERRLLNSFRNKLGISEERAAEIEKLK